MNRSPDPAAPSSTSGAGLPAATNGLAARVGWLAGPGRRRQWRRRVLLRSLAAACAVAAALGVLAVARSADSRPLVRVVVAARPLAAGEVATPGAVREVWWPANLTPESSIHSLGEVLGRPLAASLSTGELVTSPRVKAGGLLAGQPAGAVAVHVTLPDVDAVSMVSAGDRVDLWGPDGPVARAVVVLRVDRSSTTDFGAVIHGQGSSSGYATEGSGLVVSAGQDLAERILAIPDDELGRPRIGLTLVGQGSRSG